MSTPLLSPAVQHAARSLLLCIVLLFQGIGSFAQFVQVPIGTGCTVVVAGVGGNIGLNQVGAGGIVRMADGFDDPGSGGNFSFVGTTVMSWSLLGDISLQTDFNQAPPVPGANPPFQTAGPVTTVNIQSYNKNLRGSEVTTPTLARSKGRVSIVYKGTCDPVLSFDIYKQWSTTIPPVIGPDCWPTTNQLVTFAVDPVSSDNVLDAIGFDQYYWKLKNGAGTDLIATLPAAYYTAPDRSSITINMSDPAFTAWYTGGPYTVQCCYGRSNPWDGGASSSLTQLTTGSTCSAKVINAANTAPVFSNPIPTCIATNLTSITPTPSYTPLAGHTYTWTCSNSTWTLAPGAGTLAVTTMDANAATLFLTDTGPCGSTLFTYPVNRTFVGLVPTSTSTCVTPGGSFTVSLPTNVQSNCTTWSTAWPGVPVNGANSIRTITVPLGTCAGAYVINASSCTCPGNVAVTVNVRSTTPVISGPTCAPYNSAGPAQVFSSTAPCGVTSYTWSNTLGMTGSSVTNSISLAPLGTAPGLVQVIANGANACNSSAATFNVGRLPVTPVLNPYCTNVGMAGTTVFSLTAASIQPGSTYTWSFPVGLCTPSANSGTSVTEATLGAPGSYACSVTNTTPGCGNTITNFTVIVSYIDAGTGNDYSTVSVVNQSTFSTVSVPFAPGTTYQLFNCTGNTAVGTFTTQNVYSFTTLGNNSYSITVQMTNGCLARPPCVTSTHHSPVMTGGGDHVPNSTKAYPEQGDDIVVYPNPNTGTFLVHLPVAPKHATVTLFDEQGQEVGRQQPLRAGDNTVGSSDLAPGLYTVRIEVDGASFTRTVVITRE